MKSAMTDVLKEAPVAPPRNRHLIDNESHWTHYWDGSGNGRRGSDDGCSHGYMPRHLSSKASHYWSKPNGKGPPYIDSEDPLLLDDAAIRSKEELTTESNFERDSLEVETESWSRSDQSKHRMRSHDLRKDKLGQSRHRTRSHHHKNSSSDQAKHRTRSHDLNENKLNQSQHRIRSHDSDEDILGQSGRRIRSHDSEENRLDQSKHRTRSHDSDEDMLGQPRCRIRSHDSDENLLDQSKHRIRSHDSDDNILDQLRLRIRSHDSHKDILGKSKHRIRSHVRDEDTLDQSKHRVRSHDWDEDILDQSKHSVRRHAEKHSLSKEKLRSEVLESNKHEEAEAVVSSQHSTVKIDKSELRKSEDVSPDREGFNKSQDIHHSSKDSDELQCNAKIRLPSDDDECSIYRNEISTPEQSKKHQKATSSPYGAKPPIIRQSTMVEIKFIEATPEQSKVKTSQRQDSKIQSKYLRSEGSLQKTGRRSISDLGFRQKSAGLMKSNTRTMALLNNPVFRKSLAQTMRLDPNEDNFSEEVCEKLSLKVEESFDHPAYLTQSSTVPRSRVRLCCSTSDLGLLRDLHSQFEIDTNMDSSNHDSATNDYKPGQSNPANMSNVAEDLNPSQSGGNKESVESSVTKVIPRTLRASKTIANFQIPTYNEFRTLRTKQRFKSQSTTNLENLVPTILEEDSNVNSDTAGSASSIPMTISKQTDTMSDGLSNDVFHDSAIEDNPKPKARQRRRKHSKTSHPHAGIRQNSAQLLPRSISMGIISEGHDPEMVHHRSLSAREHCSDQVLSQHSSIIEETIRQQKHSLVINNDSSCDENSSHEESATITRGHKSRPKRSVLNRSQSEGILKHSCDNHDVDQETLLSDYASDSNAESSDNLLDVFLNPTNEQKSNAAVSASDVDFTLKKPLSVSGLEKKRTLSDSGCLGQSCDLELTNERRAYADDEDGMCRTTSDVSDMFAEEIRTKSTREWRTKQYKSDPLNAGSNLVNPNSCYGNLQRQDSKEDIINFLETRTMEMASNSTDGYSSEKPKRHRARHKRVTTKPPTGRKKLLSSVEIERADSGVGREMPVKMLYDQVLMCEDCADLLCHSADVNGVVVYAVCSHCIKRRQHRKKAIMEIVETEQNYGKDLNIINEHFYERMKKTGLVTPEQMQAIFINLKELIAVNQYFSTQLKNTLGLAESKGDEALHSVHVGELFLNSSSMLLAYESYCINQSAAPILLDHLLEEKDLLRIFLEVTQREKSILRKMDIKAFLMLPVQRIMKYPLLLSRLHQVTPSSHPDCDNIIQAQKKIENILELINSKTKGSTIVKLRRKQSSLRRSRELDSSVYENIEVHKVAMELLGWNRSNLHFLLTGCLLCAPVIDHMSLKRGKTLKFTDVHCVLVTLGKQTNPSFPQLTGVESAALVLVKEKGGRLQSFRDPFLLHQCVVCKDPVNADVFEVHEVNKESLLFKCKKPEEAHLWFMKVSQLIQDLSQWRHRRNALANIMLQDF